MAFINSELTEELKKFGIFDFSACYNCGNCTAVCSLTSEDESFPRNMLRYSMLGLKDEITVSLKPWLCYYCGDCSTYCPQKAYPGELMMTLRRWLTSKYDWTGLSGLLYKSVAWNVFAFLLVAAGVIAYAVCQNFSLEAIMHAGHVFEMLAIAGVFTLILLPNIIRMWYVTTIRAGIHAPSKVYLRQLSELFVHMFTQKRTLSCDDHKLRWFEHLILVIGYLSLLFITVFLNWFETGSVLINLFGYSVSAVVFIVTFHFVLERIRKTKEISMFSRSSDWFFVIWLFLMGFSAFLVRLFIDLNLLEQNLWLYLVHLIILAQWALLIVPFGKWTHFLYRSFAMYFQRIIEDHSNLSKK
ncbi:MAG: 4Fe-4S dicluster domain-containing protein [Bacteroidales bacterium]|nr:4Fe-4S dicluster domain-containing protein [Bacteroidales bacterium]